MTKLFLTFLIGCTVASCGSLAAQELVEFSARYQAKANGLNARAKRDLEAIGPNTYRLSNNIEAKLAGFTVANLRQSSELSFVDNKLRPLAYSYQLSGVSSDVQAIGFNWDAGVAVSSEDDESWTITLADSVMDPLSYQLALRRRLQANPDAQIGSIFDFQIIDGDEIELQLQQYRLTGEEVLSTSLGRMNSVKLSRVRDAGDRRSTTIWLARDWDYLLIRIEQRSRSGLRIELDLERATVNGETVAALP